MPSTLLMIIMILLLVGLTCSTARISGRTLLTILGIGGFLIFSWLFVGYLSFQRSPEVSWSAYPPLSRLQSGDSSPGATTTVESSTEEMWEHLNRSRIVLKNNQPTEEQEANVSPPKEQKTEKASEVVRPNWVDNPPTRIGNVYREVISSAAYSTVEECHQALEYRLREVVNNRIQQLVPNGYTPSLESLGLSLDFVLREICHEEWIETTQASFGEMKKVHVLMEFDAAVDKNLRQAFLRYHRSDRIAMVGSVALAVIALVMLVYGLLQADTWSRGYYTKRLFFGVPAVIIGLVFLLSNVNF